MAKLSYTGRIGNTGAQKVTAPLAGSKKGGKSTVRTGDDLRKGK